MVFYVPLNDAVFLGVVVLESVGCECGWCGGA